MQRTVRDDQQQEDLGIIRVEANLEELPVFSAAKRARREEVVTWEREGRDPATGKPIEQGMTLRPAVGLGLPAERERDLYYLVLAPLIEREGFGPKGRIGPVRYQDACSAVGWRRSGQNYDQIREAVKTLASMTVEFKNCIIDGRKRTLSTTVDKWFRAVFFEEHEAERLGADYVLKRGEFYVEAAEWFVANWEANYLKPIDTGVYRSLRTPLAKALYSYLDKRAYDTRSRRHRPEVVEQLLDLRERFRLGVRVVRDLLKEFRHAHDDLVQHWPALREARIEKLSPGRYRVVYVFSNQLELLAGDVQETKISRTQTTRSHVGDRGVGAASELERELTSRGVTAGVARKLVRKHSGEQIHRHLDVHDQEAAGTKLENPGGRLRLRIEEDWTPFEGYRSPEDRARQDAARRREAGERQREEEARERERARWTALTPEQKAEERLTRWLTVQTATGRTPSEAEIAARRSDYLQELLVPQGAD